MMPRDIEQLPIFAHSNGAYKDAKFLRWHESPYWAVCEIDGKEELVHESDIYPRVRA